MAGTIAFVSSSQTGSDLAAVADAFVVCSRQNRVDGLHPEDQDLGTQFQY